MNKLKEVKTYFSNEKIYQHYFINENDEKEGEYKDWWYNNGKLSEICYYKNGLLDGEYKEWHNNGKLSRIHYYKKGERFGISLNFRYKLKL